MGSFLFKLRCLPLAALFLTTASALPAENNLRTRATSFTSLGCFIDSPSRILPNKVISTHDMTAARCALNCAGYDYFGTQYSSECFCGSDTPTDPAPAGDCNMACSGNPDEQCGAGMRLNVYKFDTAPTTAPMAPPISGFEFKGCYTDNFPERALAGKTVATDDMTLEKCANICQVAGYPAFGVEYASECFCGTSLDTRSTKVPEVECSMTCKGDGTQYCGGPNRLNVYQVPSSVGGGSNVETVGGFRYASCWTDDVNDRALKAVDWRTDDMTVEKCADRCMGYSYFGLEYSRECFCGNELAHRSTSAPEKECAMLCMGNPSQLCGGGSRLNLYTRVAASTSVSSSSSTTATASSDIITSSSTAAPSSTSSTTSSTVVSISPSTSSSTTSSTSTSSTSQGPELTTITSCPPEPTYDGHTGERCYRPGGLPAACRTLASSTLNSRSVGSSATACKAALTRYGMTPVPAASACFPTSIPVVPSSAVAASIRSSIHDCINAPTASLICNYNADCQTKTYTVGQVPSPTPSLGVDLLGGDGTFESGTLGDWVLGASPHLTSTTVTTVNPRSGSRSLLMRYLNVNGGGNSITYNMFIIPGRQYEFNLYYRHTNPAAATSLYLYVYPDILQTDFSTAQLHDAPANVWGTRTITFTAVASWAQLVVNVGGNTGQPNDVYIDDITLKRLT
ncbi:WSC domain containing protein [Rhypophila sp. PSN 637]